MQIVIARRHIARTRQFGSIPAAVKASNRGPAPALGESSSCRKLGCRIIGSGSSVPEQIISNRDLEGLVETTDEWIRTRTGIRRVSFPADVTEAQGKACRITWDLCARRILRPGPPR